MHRHRSHSRLFLLVLLALPALHLPGKSAAQTSAAEHVVLKKRNNLGFGVVGAAFVPGPFEDPAYGAGIQARYMRRDGTLSLGFLYYRATDSPGIGDFGDFEESSGELSRWGGFFDMSFNVRRKGNYAFYVGSTFQMLAPGTGYVETDQFSRNPPFVFVGAHLGFAHRIGGKGGIHFQIEPGFGGDQESDDDPRRFGFIIAAKSGFFVF